MPFVSYCATPILNARDAIASHIRWKITLHTALRLREPLSERATRSILHPEECAIRAWLLSGSIGELRGRPEHTAALDCHAECHRQMKQIADLLNTGEFARAEQLLSGTSAFERASNAVANALMALDRAHRACIAS